MHMPTTQPARASAEAPAQPAPTYQAPRVTDLGAWQAVTLINSVPINPRTSALFPGRGGDGY